MPNVTARMKQLQANCPDGYTVAAGQAIDMLGKKELWQIFENNPEPHVTRIPQDMVDYLHASAKRVPEEWGRCLYFKVV